MQKSFYQKNIISQLEDFKFEILKRQKKRCILQNIIQFLEFVLQLFFLASPLVYFFSPIDLIPDIIPNFGFVDDFAMILFFFTIKKEVL